MKIKINKFYCYVLIFTSLIWSNILKSSPNRNNFVEKKEFKINNVISENAINWEKTNYEKSLIKKIKWEKIDGDYSFKKDISQENNNLEFTYKKIDINSFNRSIVFDNKTVGPDIGWLVPPGFKWTQKRKFDASVRGHSRRSHNQNFINWNGGDAVGQFYYQFLRKKNYNFVINYINRSVYQGKAAGGASPF